MYVHHSKNINIHFSMNLFSRYKGTFNFLQLPNLSIKNLNKNS